MRQNWPEKLWLVRHGQSQGNVARDLADEAGHHEIGIDVRDVDVPLSALGEEQAAALGRWFAALPADGQAALERDLLSLIDRFNYLPLVSRVGVDAAVSPRLAAVNAILSHVRRGSVLAVATLKGVAVDVIVAASAAT